MSDNLNENLGHQLNNPHFLYDLQYTFQLSTAIRTGANKATLD